MSETLAERNKRLGKGAGGGPAQFGAENGPEDKGNFVFFAFFLFGIGVLMPFNVLLNIFDFLIAKVSAYTLSNLI